MNILYGVQATGQGHISRARAMAQAFAGSGVEVAWLFSGRAADQLYDMEPFGDYRHRRGLTFATQGGRIRYRATLRGNDLPRFRRDVLQLDVTAFDLVVTDYEPVTAWAARRAGVRSIGIGHQYAFGRDTPVAGANWLSRTIMTRFAPVAVPVGLHWYPFADNVLPPILDLPEQSLAPAGHILVYLPFEDPQWVTQLLQQFPGHRFIQYGGGCRAGVAGNVTLRPPGTATFKRDLGASAGVVCNSGFELISECLQWGKPVLTRPLAGQMEQLSNARALQLLGYASVVPQLGATALGDWLAAMPAPAPQRYPDVAAALARWLAGGARTPVGELCRTLWQRPGALPASPAAAWDHCHPHAA